MHSLPANLPRKAARLELCVAQLRRVEYMADADASLQAISKWWNYITPCLSVSARTVNYDRLCV